MPRLAGVGRTTLELFGGATIMFASVQRYQACDLNESFTLVAKFCGLRFRLPSRLNTGKTANLCAFSSTQAMDQALNLTLATATPVTRMESDL